MRLVWLVVIAVGLLAGTAGDAAAQDARSAEGEKLFKEGQQLQIKGDTAAACARFEESQAASPAIGTLLELTWCYEQDGRVLRAWQVAIEAEKLAKTKKDSRAAGARTRVTDLEQRLARLVIRAAGAPDGTAISLDGATYETALLGVAVPLELGSHRVVATAPGYDRFEATIALTEGATSTVEVVLVKTVVKTDPIKTDPIKTDPAKTDPTKTDPKKRITEKQRSGKDAPSPGGKRRLLGIISAGAGAVLLGGATGLAFMAKGDYDGAFDDGHCDRETLGCDAEGETITSDARTKAHLATAIGVVGLGAIAAGVVLYLTAPGDAPKERARHSYLVPVVGDGAIGVAFGGSL